MRPLFCGNLDYDTRQSEVERLFRRYGRVEKIDMKSGFAFVYMEDERDAEDAIRALDRTEFGRKGRKLRVECTKHDDRGGGGGGRHGRGSRRSPGSTRPSKTLFVINFDPVSTRLRDLERHFEPYGKIVNIRIRRNFAFVQYDTQEDASKAFEATNGSKLLDRLLSVEYALRDDDERRNGHSPSRRDRDGGVRDRSPDRDRYRVRDRSPSPYGRGRERASPDYGRGPSPRDSIGRARSPERGRSRSPVNGRADSPVPDRERERSRERERERSRERDRERQRSEERGREKDREKGRKRERSEEGQREQERERSKERVREKDRERERERDRERSEERDRERGRDRYRSRSPEDRP